MKLNLSVKRCQLVALGVSPKMRKWHQVISNVLNLHSNPSLSLRKLAGLRGNI